MSKQNAQDGVLYEIEMFGGFRLAAGGKQITDSVNRTHQVWNLLEYLIANRAKSISQEELVDVLWPDGDSSSPANALKNLIYRIRIILQEYGIPNARDVIRYTRGSYGWDARFPCRVDTEQFEELIREAEKEGRADEERIASYSRVLALYKGDFLPGSSYEEWVVPLSGYYRAMYQKAVNRVCALLMQKQRYAEVVAICEKATAVDPFEESPHRYLIAALLRQNKQAAALQHYNYVTDLYYRELGVKPSDAMRELYHEIAGALSSMENDLDAIKEDLDEQERDGGAFCCEYEVFRNMYRLEARSAERTGQSVFIALLTAARRDGRAAEPREMARAMDLLLSAIRRSLRRGDVVSRYSGTQYVLMLPMLTLENGQMVLARILRAFRASQRQEEYCVHTMLQPLDTLER